MIPRSCALLLFIFISSLVQAQDFQPGRYYTRKGKRVDGYIFNPPTFHKEPHIQFKANQNDAESEKISVGKMKGFVVGADTFAILETFKAEGAVDTYVSITNGAAQVLEVGKVILYKFTFIESPAYQEKMFLAPIESLATRQRYTTTNYLVQQAGKDAVFAVRIDRGEFNWQMSDYLKINPALSDSIRAGAFVNKDTPEIIRRFNTWYKQRKASQTSAQP